MKMQGQLEIANLSDVGKKRPHNEDSTGTDAGNGLVVLADGMGGYKAGEVASAIAITTVMHNIGQGLRGVKSGQTDAKTGLSGESLLVKQAVIEANNDIFSTANDEPLCRGMGTTIVAVLFYGDRLAVAHVGDSRLYRLRNDQLEQVTTDHSLIQELVARGLYTLEEAMANTPKNLVTRALGIESSVEVDVAEEEVQADDIYLLCSDGLNDMVNDEEIRLTLRKYSANLVQAAQELVRLANQNGGKDNVSVVLVRKSGHSPQTGGFLKNLFKRS